MALKSKPPTTVKTSSKFLVLPPGCSRLLACLLVFTALFSPPASSIKTDDYSFKGLIKLGEGIVNNPEDVSVDRNGVLYTATRDGWIKRMFKNGNWQDWKMTGSNGTLLGITTTKKNDEILVCDSAKGLLKVTDDGVTVLASEFNGSQIRFANNVVEASNGNVYFTVSSTKYTPEDFYKDLLDGEPHGQLLKYDPLSNETTLELDGLYFANGVALSKDQTYAIVCESWKFRCIKHRLGVLGKKDTIFVGNLSGGPDNINMDQGGSFWISLIKMNATGIRAFRSCKEREIVLEAYNELIQLLIPMGKDAPATVINVDANGNITKKFSDPNATYISFVTSALAFQGNLYVASFNSDFMGKLPLLIG